MNCADSPSVHNMINRYTTPEMTENKHKYIGRRFYQTFDKKNICDSGYISGFNSETESYYLIWEDGYGEWWTAKDFKYWIDTGHMILDNGLDRAKRITKNQYNKNIET